jgi:hypothetical protein
MTRKPITKALFAVLAFALAFCMPVGLQAQTFADTISVFGPGNCGGNVSAAFVVGAAAGAGTGLQAVGTAFAPVYQAASSGAATDIISCGFSAMSRTQPGKGLNAIQGIAFFYGIVTTNATSENAPTCIAQTFPSPGAAETASVAAGTSLPVTSVPVIGSANLTAVTTGQFYTTYLSFTTPPALNGPYGGISCSFSFGQTGAAAMQFNTPGGIIFTNNTVAWLKRHGRGLAVDAMVRQGISKQAANLIYAHYVAKPKTKDRPMLASGGIPVPCALYKCPSTPSAPHETTIAELVSYGPAARW